MLSFFVLGVGVAVVGDFFSFLSSHRCGCCSFFCCRLKSVIYPERVDALSVLLVLAFNQVKSPHVLFCFSFFFFSFFFGGRRTLPALWEIKKGALGA